MANQDLLHTLRFPQDLRRLNSRQQRLLCQELRQQLLRTVSRTGGHLASNLGVVELTVALDTVFAPGEDRILWDVGHQSYVHKLLTGRLDRFDTLRQEGGISGFPRPSESPYDTFIGGHASTALSAAFGFARAATLQGDRHWTVAVIGDGAFAGGMVYEALNNAGRSQDRLVVVLNNNDMSISHSVGALATYLAKKRSSEGYLTLKEQVEGALKKIPVVGPEMRDLISEAKGAVRQLVYHTNLFEDFGFHYLGPVDGHDLPALLRVLARAKGENGPVVVQVNTIKGKGYPYAEQNPSVFHGVGAFDRHSGQVRASSHSFSSEFGRWMVRAAQRDPRICAITAAMADGTGLQEFGQRFPQRFYDVGIAEEHAVTFACGLAAGGMLPAFAVYSTFLQRGFDQLIHDASIQPQHVVLGVDRAGLVGEDGETHQGLFDAAFLSLLPGAAIYSPASYRDLQWALDQAFYHWDGLVAVRYPRGQEPQLPELCNLPPAPFTHQVFGPEQGELLLVSYGRECQQVWRAAKALQQRGIQADLLKLTQIWPLPQECLRLAKRYPKILFVEEGIQSGGIGEHFLAALAELDYRGKMKLHGIRKPFQPAMPVDRALERCRLDAASLECLVLEYDL